MMSQKKYLLLIVIHALLGVMIYAMPSLSKIYGILILLLGFFYVLRTRNVNNEVLIVSAYIVGSEVFLRMTGGNVLYEFSKYGVLIFMLLGMFYSGFSKNAIPFWIYILLLLPGVLVASETLNLTTNIRTTIAFNISGPVCLGIAAIYSYQRKISFSRLNTVLFFLGLPIISTVAYLILYTPELKTVLINTSSNYETSGGFGPNQVATILGLGMYVFFTRLMFESKNKFTFIINLILALSITYRGLVTFSRGGMLTGFAMILVLLLFVYINMNSVKRLKLYYMFAIMSIAVILTWIFTSSQTEGLIDKRYANQDAMGRKKESNFSGREDIFESEIEAFMDSPILGVGVAKGLELRKEQTGLIIASHNEITRSIAEHGVLGIIALLIVFFTPIFLYLDNKQNLYLFCFVLFWLFTINHAAMRIAAPAFVYALSLLKVSINEE
jgi:hypothetical protein